MCYLFQVIVIVTCVLWCHYHALQGQCWELSIHITVHFKGTFYLSLSICVTMASTGVLFVPDDCYCYVCLEVSLSRLAGTVLGVVHAHNGSL